MMRSFLYTLARLLADLGAIRRGKIGRRIARRGGEADGAPVPVGSIRWQP